MSFLPSSQRKIHSFAKSYSTQYSQMRIPIPPKMQLLIFFFCSLFIFTLPLGNTLLGMDSQDCCVLVAWRNSSPCVYHQLAISQLFVCLFSFCYLEFLFQTFNMFKIWLWRIFAWFPTQVHKSWNITSSLASVSTPLPCSLPLLLDNFCCFKFFV